MSTSSPPPLQYRDVFVLTRSMELNDNVLDDSGAVVKQACGFVHSLRNAGVPTGVVWWNPNSDDMRAWHRGVLDMAVAAKEEVIVAHHEAAAGMERKIVVYLPGRALLIDDELTEDDVEADDRLLTLSRCTTQLVMIDMP